MLFYEQMSPEKLTGSGSDKVACSDQTASDQTACSDPVASSDQVTSSDQVACSDQVASSGDEQKAVLEKKEECSEPRKLNVELSKELADVSKVLVSNLASQHCYV